jgi:hypothetical protein
VKTKHRNLPGLLQPFPVIEWKWEAVTVDFITKFPKIVKKHESIMVMVDKLTKDTHFIIINTTHKETNIAEINMKEVSMLHGVPKEIVSNIYPKFTSNFWKRLFKVFWTNLNLNTVYHLESNGKKERTNTIIEYILIMCVMEYPSKWEDYIHLVEFSYNNGYQFSLKMIPFEALYGRKCNTPVRWDNPAYVDVIGIDLLK